jgi:hypothetical protein
MFTKGTRYGKFPVLGSSRGEFPQLNLCRTTGCDPMGTWELGKGGRALPAGSIHRLRGGTGVPSYILFLKEKV